MDEDLNTNFDLIVLGTGFTESLIAAAAARIGKKVLHLDRNAFYGGNWASFSLSALQKWAEEIKKQELGNGSFQNKNDFELDNQNSVYSNIKYKWHYENLLTDLGIENDRLLNDQQPVVKQTEVVSSDAYVLNCDLQNYDAKSEPNKNGTIASNVSVDVNFPSGEISNSTSFFPVEPENLDSQKTQCSKKELEETKAELACQLAESNNEMDILQLIETNSENSTESCGSNTSLNSPLIPESIAPNQGSMETQNDSKISDRKKFSKCDLEKVNIKFNIDLIPKVLYCKGPLVDLLISSNVSRYLEFKCLTRILSWLSAWLLEDNKERESVAACSYDDRFTTEGKLVEVPCSKNHVFASKVIRDEEKYLLMKFMKFCYEYQNKIKEWKDFEGRTFLEFLKDRKLTDRLIHFILTSIAMVNGDVSCEIGLERTNLFLIGIGRFSASIDSVPFLFPLYGCGEIPQSFCRLCAVFGGIYILRTSLDYLKLISNEDSEPVTDGNDMQGGPEHSDSIEAISESLDESSKSICEAVNIGEKSKSLMFEKSKSVAGSSASLREDSKSLHSNKNMRKRSKSLKESSQSLGESSKSIQVGVENSRSTDESSAEEIESTSNNSNPPIFDLPIWAVLSEGRKFKGTHVVMNIGYLPSHLKTKLQKKCLSRAIFITDSSVLPSDKENYSLINLPCDSSQISQNNNVLELTHGAAVCPIDTYLVHMTCLGHDSEKDFESSVRKLFNFREIANLSGGVNYGSSSNNESRASCSNSDNFCEAYSSNLKDATEASCSSYGGADGASCSKIQVNDMKNFVTDNLKPNILFSLYFNQDFYELESNTFADYPNVYFCDGISPDADYELGISEAKKVFSQIFPNEEFLPRAPDHNEIDFGDNDSGIEKDNPDSINIDNPDAMNVELNPINVNVLDPMYYVDDNINIDLGISNHNIREVDRGHDVIHNLDFVMDNLEPGNFNFPLDIVPGMPDVLDNNMNSSSPDVVENIRGTNRNFPDIFSISGIQEVVNENISDHFSEQRNNIVQNESERRNANQVFSEQNSTIAHIESERRNVAQVILERRDVAQFEPGQRHLISENAPDLVTGSSSAPDIVPGDGSNDRRTPDVVIRPRSSVSGPDILS